MGQSEQKAYAEKYLQKKTSSNYEIDIRLIERHAILPSSFSYSIQKEIDEVQELNNKIKPHHLERYLINCIDDRFHRYNYIKNTNINSDSSYLEILGIDLTKFQNKYWFQLQNKEIFLKLLKMFHEKYAYDQQIFDEFNFLSQSNKEENKHNRSTNFQTLRKPAIIQPSKHDEIDEGLIMRLIFHYYIVMLKKNVNQTNRNVLKFHLQTGRLLCYLIFFGYLSIEKLFQIIYWLVYIDKHDEDLMKSKLDLIHRTYNEECLKNSYRINISSKRLNILETASRIYLDQLYMKSIQEAEDPDIKTSDDILLPVQTFPISRVKDKSKT